jgi:general secretion pathway protein A
MYRKHFGLTAFPFDKEIPADELFVSSAMHELSVRLGHLVEMSGIGLLTGDPGSGKSCAARAMTARLHQGLYKVLYVPLSTGNPMDLYKSIAWELGLPVERSRAALYHQIKHEVTRLMTEARTRPVLILDEAQGLRSDVLEEMRLLVARHEKAREFGPAADSAVRARSRGLALGLGDAASVAIALNGEDLSVVD